MALLLAYNLEAAGHLVSVIASGTGAVEHLVAAEPELVVLDWELPGLSGIEVLRQIRQRLSPRRVPVIMLTGRNGSDDRTRALGTGADIFLSKPFAMTELMRDIAALLANASVAAGGSGLPPDGATFRL